MKSSTLKCFSVNLHNSSFFFCLTSADERTAKASLNCPHFSTHFRVTRVYSIHFIWFLDASSHLYVRVCPSVRVSVRPFASKRNRRKTRISACGILLPPGACWMLLPSVLKGVSDRPSVRPSVRHTRLGNLFLEMPTSQGFEKRASRT